MRVSVGQGLHRAIHVGVLWCWRTWTSTVLPSIKRTKASQMWVYPVSLHFQSLLVVFRVLVKLNGINELFVSFLCMRNCTIVFIITWSYNDSMEMGPLCFRNWNSCMHYNNWYLHSFHIHHLKYRAQLRYQKWRCYVLHSKHQTSTCLNLFSCLNIWHYITVFKESRAGLKHKT